MNLNGSEEWLRQTLHQVACSQAEMQSELRWQSRMLVQGHQRTEERFELNETRIATLEQRLPPAPPPLPPSRPQFLTSLPKEAYLLACLIVVLFTAIVWPDRVAPIVSAFTAWTPKPWSTQ